jgi:hypothetical protein
MAVLDRKLVTPTFAELEAAVRLDGDLTAAVIFW